MTDDPRADGSLSGELLVPDFTDGSIAGELVPDMTDGRVDTRNRKPSFTDSFSRSFTGARASQTIMGAASEGATLSIARGGPQRETPAWRKTINSIGADEFPLPDREAEKIAKQKQAALDQVYNQIAYDLSDTDWSAGAFLGNVAGTMTSPESLGGISGLLARRVPMLAGETLGRTMARSAVDAGLVNAAQDAAAQGIRAGSGAQDKFHPEEVAGAAVAGGLLGAGMGAAGKGLATLAGRMAERALPSAALTPEERAASEGFALRMFDPEYAQRELAATPGPRTVQELLDMPEPAPRSLDASGVLSVQPDRYEPPIALPTGEPAPPVEVSARLAEQPSLGPVSVIQKENAAKIEADLGTPINGTLLRQLRGMPEATTPEGGIVAFHGSPHDFERFSLDKIGTGEGAQAYGHGLYFAENEGVAKGYRDDLTRARVAPATRAVAQFNGDVDAAISASRAEIDRLRALDLTPETGSAKRDSLIASQEEKLAELVAFKTRGEMNKGRMYQVRIDAHPDHFLDWDKPLSEQSAYVRDAVRGFAEGLRGKAPALTDAEFRKKFGGLLDGTPYSGMPRHVVEGVLAGGADSTKFVDLVAQESAGAARKLQNAIDNYAPPEGWQIYKKMAATDGQTFNGVPHFNAAGEATDKLREAGIAGIRYLDGGSRKAGEGTSNLVVFDDSKIHITHKNGEALAKPMPAVDYLRGEAQAKFTSELKAALKAELPQAPENIIAEQAAAPVAKKPRAVPEREANIFAYLESIGGLKPDGDLRQLLPKGSKGNKLLRDGGMSVDDALISLREAGYLRDPGLDAGGQTSLLPQDLYNLIDRQASGDDVFPMDYVRPHTTRELREIDRRERAITKRADEIRKVVEGDGTEPVDPAILRQAATLMHEGHERDPVAAFDRAAVAHERAAYERELMAQANEENAAAFLDDSYETYIRRNGERSGKGGGDAQGSREAGAGSGAGADHARGGENAVPPEAGRGEPAAVPGREAPRVGPDDIDRIAARRDEFIIDFAKEIGKQIKATARTNGKRTATIKIDALAEKYGLSPRGHDPLDMLSGHAVMATLGEKNPLSIAQKIVDGYLTAKNRARIEPGADGKPQTIIPGAERSPDAVMAQRAADAPIKGKVAQNFDTSGLALFGDGHKQETLFRGKGGGTAAGNPHIPNQMNNGKPRVDQGTVSPAEAKVQTLSQISRELTQAFPSVAREGHVTPGAQGQYNTRSGVIRLRNVSDFDTLSHEVGHDLYFGRGKNSEFEALVNANRGELSAFGANGTFEGNAEAFADLFHLYVTNIPFLKKGFPQSFAALDGMMRSEFPAQAEALDRIRQSLDVLNRAPSGEAPHSVSVAPPGMIGRMADLARPDKDPFGRVVFSAFDHMYTAAVDSAHPVYRAVTGLAEIAKRNGKPVNLVPVDDAYILARRIPGAHGKADAFLKYGLDPDHAGPSLAGAMEKAFGPKKWDAEAYQKFNDYLTSRRMIAEYARKDAGDLARNPGPRSLGDYQADVAAYEAQFPQFAGAADELYAFQRQYLKRMLDKHMVTREYYDAAIARQDYVPLQRDMRGPEGGLAQLTGAGTGGNGLLSKSVMKAFKGSDRDVIHPLESIFKRVHDIEFVIARNDSMRALARLANEAGPGSGYIAEHIPNKQLTAHKVDVIDALKAAGKQAGIDDVDLHALILQAEDTLGDGTWATLFSQKEIKEGAEPIVYYWENGERQALRLADRRFGQELHHAVTALTDYEQNFFVNVLALGSALLRNAVTKSPDFILVNFLRDQGTSMLTGGRKNIPFVSAAKGLYEALTKTDMAKDFAKQGGLAGGAIVHSIDSSQFGHNIRALQKGNPLLGILKAFELSETGTRLGLYESYLRQAKELGWDDENAALWAAFKTDDYIDFRKHGSAMGAMRRTMTFMNANIQGTDKEIRALADLPVLERKRGKGETLTAQEEDRLKDARIALIRTVTMATVLGAGLAYYNRDNEKIQKAPKYTKNNNFLFSFAGMDWSYPKPFGVVQAVVNAFQYGTEYAIRRDPTLALDWLKATGESLMPPTTNPLIGTGYGLAANYDYFRERNIVPYYMQSWDKTEQHTPYTSGMSIQIAKAANSVGLELSPMKLDYLFSNLGGSMSRDIQFGWDKMMGSARPEKQIYEYPVLRRFIKNLDRGAQSERAFYELVGNQTGRLEGAENAYKGKIRTGERTGAAEYYAGMKEDEKIWTALNSFGFSTAEKKMHPLYNARERVAIATGLLRQVVSNNVIKEEDLDKKDLTISRRDAKPIDLSQRARAQLADELQSLSVATSSNAMIAMEAKGTRGLAISDTTRQLERIRAISPEVFTEYEKRLKAKNLPDFDTALLAWPEMKRRLLVDGENASLADLVPVKNRGRARR